ncbi:hypothetical protein RHGRI_024295 [Rhododendron griersonianum]|uniref:Calmodulin-binding protein n=1 Tax=Rhododendron griersonianum TaxID=479676 RepID=A0AAV6J938_9ERIC|nr:hypothetical protein RHGRI_024295 [Rhododendron griersonianum]
MTQKRQQQDDCRAPSDGNRSEDKRRKLPSLRNVILEVMSLRKVQLCVEPVLEPLIRRVVKEEVESALRKYLSNMNWNTVKQRESFESRSLQLQFLPKISLPIFTGSRIEGEDCNALTVALVDGLTGQVVYSGPESSAKVEIVVLEGDFDGDERGNWTLEEFNNNIVRERIGKKPLLTGDLFLALEAGIGLVGEVSFTDNSSWTRSRKFRLGARVVDNFEGVRVKEAKTESFIVRDHRGELDDQGDTPDKDYYDLETYINRGEHGTFVPLQSDEPLIFSGCLCAWFEKKIGTTDFEIIEGPMTIGEMFPFFKGMVFEYGVDAASEDMEIVYKKHHPPSLDDEVWRLEKIGKDGAFHKRLNREKVNSVKDFLILLFLDPTRLRNILGTGMSTKMWEVTVDHAQTCILDPRWYFYYPGSQQKTGVVFSVEDAHNMVIAAFKNWEKVVSFENEASLINASAHFFSNILHANSADIKVLTSQEIGGFDYPQVSVCSPDNIPSIYSMGSVKRLDDFGLHDIDHLDLRYDETLNFHGQVANSLTCEPESVTRAFSEDVDMQYFGADGSFQSGNSCFESDLHSAVNGFLLSRSAAFAQRRWTMVFSVLKWDSGIRDSGNERYLSKSRSLQLQFVHGLSLPILTGINITGENNTSIGIVLFDVRTGEVVNSGPEASANVEIVVLKKDFNGHDWSLEEFNSKIVWKREGGKTLLVGDVNVKLKEGIGSIGDIHFSHTKRWMKKVEFRLGARTVDGALGHRVREAKTESFFVKDRRLELCKKNHPPSLSDAVWRLEKINKDGAFHDRLSKENINTVKDFMTLFYMDRLRLKQILGRGMSTAMWKVTENHAQTYIPDPRLYVYCPGFQQKTGVVFSVVGQVMGLLSECEYTRLDKLSETEKGDAHNMVIAAFKNWEKVVPFDDEASLFTNASAHFFSNILHANSADIKVLTSQEVGGFDCPQVSVCSPVNNPSVYSMGGVRWDDFDLDLLYDGTLNFHGQVANSLGAGCSFQSGNSCLESDLQSVVDQFSVAFAQRNWTMLSTVLKWFSIWKGSARENPCQKKKAKTLLIGGPENIKLFS